jgi:hypothetical protein
VTVVLIVPRQTVEKHYDAINDRISASIAHAPPVNTVNTPV